MNRDNPSNFRDREEERFRPGQGAESWRQRGGRTGGAYGDGYRYQGGDVGTFGNPGGGYGEYNWERGGDFGDRGREEYNRWGDEIGRGREGRFSRDYERGEYGGGDYGRNQWGGERESGWGRGETSYGGYGRGQGSMGSEGYRSGGSSAGHSGSGSGGYGSGTYGSEGGGGWESSRYGQGPSNHASEGYRTEGYGSYGQTGSRDWKRSGGTSQWTRGHYGKGPKGYTRSDERLREDVSDRLTEDPEVDASGLTVNVKDAEITLDGTVPERHMKRRAEDIAEGVMGVKQVHNKLRVEGGERKEMAEAGSLGVGTSVTSSGSPIRR